MNLIIQQIGADGNTKYLEKVATCQPDGNVSMTIDVFDEAMCEQRWDIDCMKEGGKAGSLIALCRLLHRVRRIR